MAPDWLRGRGRLGGGINWLFGPGRCDEESLRVIRMKGGWRVKLDLRSGTERSPFYTGVYDTRRARSFLKLIDPRWTVVDVGAHIGLWSVPLAHRLDERLGGRLVAIEPVPPNVARLRENLALNGLGNIATVVPVALGEEPGTCEIQVTEAGLTSNACVLKNSEELPEATNPGRIYEVPVNRMDDIFASCALRRCDFIKIDVEGFELPFIQGAMKTFTEHKPILLGEFNNYFMAQWGFTFDSVWEHVAPLGYVWYLETKRGWVPFEGQKTDTQNLLLWPRSRMGPFPSR